jgi:hypothetical protein
MSIGVEYGIKLRQLPACWAGLQAFETSRGWPVELKCYNDLILRVLGRDSDNGFTPMRNSHLTKLRFFVVLAAIIVLAAVGSLNGQIKEFDAPEAEYGTAR